MKIKHKVILLISILLILDQIIKFLVKTNMFYGETIHVIGNWFQIHFIENNGMAFGYELGGKTGKVILTLFRIVAVSGLVYFISLMIKKDAPTGFILALALITTGAAGNIIDSMFYGMIFSDSPYNEAATLFPEGGGYSSFMHGRVVDWAYFPIINGTYPDWFPWKAGQQFIFFRPVFNLADSCITVGVAWILLFQRKQLRTL